MKDIANYLHGQSDRDYIMFLTGTNTGLRISDILQRRVSEVKGRKSMIIREQKTGKRREVKFTRLLRKELSIYCQDKNPDDYLFKSRQGHNRPISRSMAYKILQKAADEFHIDSIGTHTLRKTFGYHFYLKTKNVVMLQKIFNHSHPAITLRYIGIEQEEINREMDDFHIY